MKPKFHPDPLTEEEEQEAHHAWLRRMAELEPDCGVIAGVPDPPEEEMPLTTA
jgi:hypothetical protein